MIYWKWMRKKGLSGFWREPKFMVKAVFFDSGNVLVKEGFVSSIKEYEEKYNIPEGRVYASAHDRQWWKDFTLGQITEQEYWDHTVKDFAGDLNIQELRQLILKNFIPNSDLFDYIKTLRKRFILGVISNNPREWFDYFWGVYNWDELFQIKAVSSYIHIRKPDIRIYQYALTEARVSGSEAVYIDDRPDRIEGAVQLGIKILIYNNLEQLKKELANI